MVRFRPELPESLKAGQVFEFQIVSDSPIRTVEVRQEHPSKLFDRFNGKNSKVLNISFDVNLASTGITIIIRTEETEYRLKRLIHWLD